MPPPSKQRHKKTSPSKAGPAATHSAKGKATEREGDRIVEASFLGGAAQLDQFPPPAFSEIAFAGRSNVGKSSLMNCLTGRRNLVRTSSTPGCTRQVSWFRSVSDDKSVVDLVDLPGYGYAKRSKGERSAWAHLIESYLLHRVTLRGVCVLVDVRRGLEEEEHELMKMLAEPPTITRPPLEVVLVATKLDKLSSSARKPTLTQLSRDIGMSVLGFSAEDGTGRVPLWRQLRRIAGVGAASVPSVDSDATEPQSDATEPTD